MPRLYVTPAEFNESPWGIALGADSGQLASGVLDKLIARASMRCDSYVRRRLQAPGTTTLSLPATAGQQSISVASTLTLDNASEQAVIIDSGNGAQETVQIQAGGVTVSSWTSPYPGTVQLTTPLQFSHSSNAPVTYCYKEVAEAISSSSGDPYSEAIQSQAAQLALAHLPVRHAGLTRITFTKTAPIQSVQQIEHAYSFDVTYNNIDLGAIIIEPNAGFIRYRVGEVMLPEGFTRVTYIAGYQSVPDDVKDACLHFVADAIGAMSNPLGVYDMTGGKVKRTFRENKSQLTGHVAEAQQLLKKYRRLV